MIKLTRRQILAAAGSVTAFPTLIMAQTPNPPSGLSVNGSTKALSTGNRKKWNPGHYMQTQAFTLLGNSTLSEKQKEISILRAGPAAVLGWQGWYQWRALENSSAGAYDFSSIDADYRQVTGYVSGTGASAIYSAPRRMHIQIYFLDYFFPTAPTSRELPDYIANTSAYGPVGPNGTNYGYWTYGYGHGTIAAYWRPAVLNRLLALYQAIANHVLPDGYTVDQSPYIESFAPYGESVDAATPALPAAGSDPTCTPAAIISAYNAINKQCQSYFPHTSVLCMNNYFADGGSGQGGSQSVVLMESLASTQTAASGPDTFGFSSGQVPNQSTGTGLTFGQAAYIGLIPSTPSGYNGSWAPGGTDLRSSVPYIASIQGDDFQCGGGVAIGGGYTPLDIFKQLNVTLRATHAMWSYQDPNNSPGAQNNTLYWFGSVAGASNPQASWTSGGDGANGVLTVITQNPLSNTSYPSSYPT